MGDRNATTIVLHANHRDLVKFSAKENDNYKTVIFHLKENSDTAPAAVREKWTKEDGYRGSSGSLCLYIADDCSDVAKGESTSLEVVQAKVCPLVARNYIERTGIQSLITQKLLPTSREKRQPRCILHGLGGAGKTQLATNWIQEHESKCEILM